jgi:hypothetical protein
MTAEKKKQLQTLLALGVLLAGAATYAYLSLRQPAVKAATPAEKVARVASLPSASDAQIRLDLIRDSAEKDVVGRRNVFQYYVPPPPPKPPPVIQPAVVTRVQTNTTPAPPSPPPAPPSALDSFKFDAVGIVAKPGQLMASITDGPNRYKVTEGEYILGRYRINKLTENSVEIEDLDQNRRRTYNRITQ